MGFQREGLAGVAREGLRGFEDFGSESRTSD
jgi:hypothetical protein